ncbi:MAG TPA: EAL domain-containing protein, partial [Thermotogota bacterium]|nr:EAL domain-containing protein [Thermotogota bacterium]
LVYHYQPEMITKNIFEDFQSESLKTVHARMLNEDSGHGFYVIDWIIHEGVFYDKITAWNGFTIANKQFKVAKTAELDEMNKELTRMRNSGILLIVLIFATLSILFAININIQTRFLQSASNHLQERLRKKTKEIRENEEKFKTYIENAQDLVLHIDNDFHIEYASPSAKTILGYAPVEMIHLPLLHFIDRKNAPKITSLTELEQNIRTKGLISPMIRKDSRTIHIEWSISSGNYKDGEVYQLIGRDVTEKQQTESKLKKTAAFRRELLDFSARILDRSLEKIPYQELLERTLKYIEGTPKGAILMKCPDERYRFAASYGYDQRMLDQISLSEDELFDANNTQPLIKTTFERHHSVDSEIMTMLSDAGFKNPSSVMTVPIFIQNELSARFSVDRFDDNEPFTDEDLDIARLFAQQIQVYLERQLHEKNLIEEKDKFYALAMFDSLTQLPNRLNTEMYFQNKSLSAKRQDHALALVYINVKKFKDLNAIFGRSFGDDILITIARRLQNALTKEEFTARFESDEFILIIPHKDRTNLINRVQTIGHALKNPYDIHDMTISLNFKIGISLYPDDGTDFNALFKNAGIAANQKDATDDEMIFFKSTQVQKITQRLFMEQQLKRAIDNPLNFQMVYQPCVRLDSSNRHSTVQNNINHLEALIRWTAEDGRMVPPSLFIPIAEETGMIHKLGKIIAEQVTAQIAYFGKNGKEFPVSMNLSAKELMRKDIVQMLDQILQYHAISAEKMGIEITESALIEDLSNSVDKLKAFKQLGMNISIDDFGTGYSSLSYINRFPIDYIKIDKSFVDNITSEENSRAIVKTIISLTESLGAKAIAEGVETKAQLEILYDLGCNIIQGYYFYKPMPASAILDLSLSG